ncbi:hypothetical protein OG417_47820 [Actinoallomurus sp. NBC_01490]|uniref:hypothetical protein n=1 Tax=Actinoallomurus sp. NBC_01490 TaxID=2903557 RepID=UPI002E2EF923|nr:hypothetical protein [Actinoallomurus sp. NBC_01490]
MAIRLALAGVVLIVVGVLDLGGIGPITAVAGAVALVAAGVVWSTTRRKAS